jgi:hypothetical protein
MNQMKNPNIKINTEILSDNWYLLNKVTLIIKKKTTLGLPKERSMTGMDCHIIIQHTFKTVVLTRQFRLPPI